MCSTYSQALLPAYLLFPIHDVQEPGRTDYQREDQSASSFFEFPQNFLRGRLYSLLRLRRQLLKELNLPSGAAPFEDRCSTLSASVEGVIGGELPAVNPFFKFFLIFFKNPGKRSKPAVTGAGPPP